MRDSDTTSPIAFGAWLGFQLAALAVASMRISLSSRYPRAGEELALAVMLATQVTAASLFFPVLLRTPRWTIVAIAAAFPLAAMASFLADVSIQRGAICELYVSFWMLGLHVWSRALAAPSTRIYAAALAAMVSVGGPALWYLRAEFVLASSVVDWSNAGAFGPVMGALSILSRPFNLIAWVLLSLFVACGAIAATIKRNASSATKDKPPILTS